MHTQANLINLLIDVITNGDLDIETNKGRTRFELTSETCSVSGPLIVRRDWADAQGRPGLMSMIQQVELIGIDSTCSRICEVVQEQEEFISCLLQERLSPERLYVLSPDKGWLLSAVDMQSLDPLIKSEDKSFVGTLQSSS